MMDNTSNGIHWYRILLSKIMYLIVLRGELRVEINHPYYILFMETPDNTKSEVREMSRIVVVDNEFGTLWYYPEKRIVHHKFHKFTYEENFRHILTTGAEVLEKHRCRKWLSDDRQIGILHPDDRAWGDENWTPRVIKAGWRYWAVLMPSMATGQMSLNNLADAFSQLGVTVRAFEEEDEGIAWLEAQK
jgi:hypothetical protein